MISSSIRGGQTVENLCFSFKIKKYETLFVTQNFLIKMLKSMLKNNLFKTRLLKT